MNVRQYYHYITNRKKNIACVHCCAEMAPSKMNRHMRIAHSLDIKKVCVWCLIPLQNVSTNTTDDYNHRLICFSRRYKQTTSRKVTVCDLERNNVHINISHNDINHCLLNSQTIDKWIKYKHTFSRNLFGNYINQTWEYIPMLASTNYPLWLVNEVGVETKHLKYFLNNFPMDIQLTGFDPFLQRAYIYKNNVIWLRIELDMLNLSCFLEIVQEYGHTFFFLPHWRMSKIIKKNIPRYYRNMIAVIQMEYKNVLMKRLSAISKEHKNYIKQLGGCPKRNFALLMDTIVELSSPNENKTYASRGKSNCVCIHYLINQPVVPHAQIFAMLYIPHGLQLYLSQNYCTRALCKLPFYKKSNKWQIKLCDILPLKNTIFPIIRHMQFKEIKNETEWNNFLFIGNKTYTSEFNEELTRMSLIDWNYAQARNKNFLLNNAIEATFYPNRQQQQILNIVHEVKIHCNIDCNKKTN